MNFRGINLSIQPFNILSHIICPSHQQPPAIFKKLFY